MESASSETQGLPLCCFFQRLVQVGPASPILGVCLWRPCLSVLCGPCPGCPPLVICFFPLLFPLLVCCCPSLGFPVVFLGCFLTPSWAETGLLRLPSSAHLHHCASLPPLPYRPPPPSLLLSPPLSLCTGVLRLAHQHRCAIALRCTYTPLFE